MLLVLLPQVLDALPADSAGPCAILVREVKVSVGYWHRDGIESKQRIDGMLAATAKKFVLDLLSILVKVARHVHSLLSLLL